MCVGSFELGVEVLFAVIFVYKVVNTLAVLHVLGYKSQVDHICALLQVLLWEVNSVISKWLPILNLGAVDDQTENFFTLVIHEDLV